MIGDVNRELVDTYTAVQERPDRVEGVLMRLLEEHCHENFYKVRDDHIPADIYDVAARMLYLNKTCFNGIYRVNRCGRFNVPIGDRRGASYRRGDLARVAKSLSAAELICGDFEVSRSLIGPNDLVYLDPPYALDRNSDGFIRYNDKLFSWADQMRLADFAEQAVRVGATVVMTNANHHALIERYASSGLFRVQPISRYSSISANGAKRAFFEELLISSKDVELGKEG